MKNKEKNIKDNTMRAYASVILLNRNELKAAKKDLSVIEQTMDTSLKQLSQLDEGSEAYTKQNEQVNKIQQLLTMQEELVAQYILNLKNLNAYDDE